MAPASVTRPIALCVPAIALPLRWLAQRALAIAQPLRWLAQRACAIAQPLRWLAQGACAIALLLVWVAPGAFASNPARPGAPTVLTPTPYMGWDTYFAFGPRYSESTVLAQASALVSEGFARRGYRYVWLDVGWWQGQRGSNGQILVNRQQWPHGMAWLAHTLHAAGLLAGLYTDAGVEGCGGRHQGSYGHYRQDADTFSAWGFDAVKVDFCGGVRLHLNPATAYASFHAALQANSSHRPMLLSICDFLEPGQFHGDPPFAQSAFSSYTFGPSTGNSWRTDTDVGSPGRVTFATVLRNIDADAAHPEAAGPGHWNDPDYLGPDQGLTAAQFRTQLSMWAMLAAPLMISDDLEAISPSSRAALENPAVLAIDQDPAGVQGTLVSSNEEGQVWSRPLSDGSRAVALLNRGPTPLWVQTSASAVGLPPAARYAVRDVWSARRYESGGPLGAQVQPDATVLLRVSPLPSRAHAARPRAS
jgi:alpha-galactosidase